MTPQTQPDDSTDPLAEEATILERMANFIREILGGDRRAQRHARMCWPGEYSDDRKYVDVHGPLSDEQIVAHLRGEATYGVRLIDEAGRARAGVLDEDHQGEEGAWSILRAGETCGVVLFSIVVPGAHGHDGSHTWALYASDADPLALRAQMQTVARVAGLPPTTETWPTNRDIRLLGGVHTHTGRLGVLLLQDGRRFDLDQDQQTAGFAAILALPRNPPPPPLPSPPSPTPPVARPRPVAHDGRGSIAQYNQETDLVDLLVSYGAKVARATRDGAILHCPCGHHQHGDRHASIEIRPGRNNRQVVIGYAPSCAFHGDPHKVFDAFGVYCVLEGVSAKEAIRRLYGERPPPRAPRVTAPPPPSMSDPGPPQQRVDTARPEQRPADQQDILAAIATRAMEEPALNERARNLLSILIEQADAQLQCRPSNAELMERMHVCKRTVQRAFGDLARLGFGTRTGGRGYADRPGESTPATWTFAHPDSPRVTAVPTLQPDSPRVTAEPPSRPDSPRVTAAPAPGADVSPSLNTIPSQTPVDHACEGGGDAGQPSAALPAGAIVASPSGSPGDEGRQGASYDPALNTLPEEPASGREWSAELSPKELLGATRHAGDLGDWRLREPDADDARAPDDALRANDRAEPSEPILVHCPPQDPDKQKRYYQLLGAARKAKSARQRQWLKDQAAALEEYRPPDEARDGALPEAPRPSLATEVQHVRARAGRPPSQAPPDVRPAPESIDAAGPTDCQTPIAHDRQVAETDSPAGPAKETSAAGDIT